MTFPWRKVKKNTRISELLNNQIHQRRKGGGSPLVVETGFPTSLVDLFVKNKDRLKRQSKKNSKYSPLPPPPPPPPPPSDNDDSLLPTPFPSPTRSATVFGHNQHPHRQVPGDANANAVVAGRGGVCEGERGGDEGVDGNRVLMAILRMFLVVVLVLGTKNLVVGITASAFLLVFLEYVCKLSGSCTGVVEKLGFMKHSNEIVEEADNESKQAPMLARCSVLKNQDQGQEMSNPTRKIGRNEELEGERERVEKLNASNMKFDEGKEGIQDMESKNVVVQEEGKRLETGELRTKKSRRAKMKHKIKELVPRKLRSSRRKGGRELENEETQIRPDNAATFAKEDDDPNRGLKESKPDNDLSLKLGDVDDQKDVIDMNYAGDQVVEGNEEEIGIREEEEEVNRTNKQNCGYVFLFLIVLFGLIGGRISALVLTLGWCLVKKSGDKLRQYMKLPFLRSSVKESS